MVIIWLMMVNNNLVGGFNQPSEKTMELKSVGMMTLHSQLNGKIRHVPNYQPVFLSLFFLFFFLFLRRLHNDQTTRAGFPRHAKSTLKVITFEDFSIHIIPYLAGF